MNLLVDYVQTVGLRRTALELAAACPLPARRSGLRSRSPDRPRPGAVPSRPACGRRSLVNGSSLAPDTVRVVLPRALALDRSRRPRLCVRPSLPRGHCPPASLPETSSVTMCSLVSAPRIGHALVSVVIVHLRMPISMCTAQSLVMPWWRDRPHDAVHPPIGRPHLRMSSSMTSKILCTCASSVISPCCLRKLSW